ncbi:MAG: extracellular solute-binding protein family 1 [Clostridia bacterium]|nr:extracellular solute-binding protein family 1 [Clostridia bacterium]
MIKKLLPLLLVLAITFSFLSACGGDTAETPEEKDEPKTYTDTDGYEFIFKVYKHSVNAPELAPEVSFSNLGDKILQRYDEVEQTFNCVMTVEVMDGTNDNILASNLAGEKCADLMDTQADRIATGKKDLFVPMNEWAYVPDFASGKYGTEGQLNVLTFGDKIYGVRNAYWGVPWPSFKGVLFFNPRILRDGSQPSPFELIESKNWTWDTFEDMCIALTYPAAGDEEAKFGTAISTSGIFPSCAVLSNGAAPVRYNESADTYEYGLNDPKALQALDWVNKLINDSKCAAYLNDWWEVGAKGFINGLYAFYVENAWTGFMEGPSHFATDMKEEYGWAPFPNGPSGEYGKWAAEITNEKRFIGMPVSPDEEYDIVLEIMDYMFEPLPGDDVNSWKDTLEKNFFYDDGGSFKYYLEMMEDSVTDYSTVMKDGMRDASKGVLFAYQKIIAGAKTPIEMVEQIKPFVESEIDKYLNNPVE